MFVNCLIEDGVCRCACHNTPGVLHIMPCCDQPRWEDKADIAEVRAQVAYATAKDDSLEAFKDALARIDDRQWDSGKLCLCDDPGGPDCDYPGAGR